MDVIGNNIANVNTFGFKKARATFRDQFYSTLKGSSEANNVYGGGNPSQVGYGSLMSSVDVDYGTGSGAPTGNGMDVMILGNGFFLVGNYAGNGYARISNAAEADYGLNLTALSLTRVGIFNVDGQGNLVDSGSNYVYGFLNNSPYGTAADSTTNPPTPYAYGDRLEMLQVPMMYYNTNGDPYLDANGNYVTVPYQATGTAPAVYDLDSNGQRQLDLTGQPTDTFVAPMALKNLSIGTDGTVTGMNDLDKIVTIGQIAVANVPNPNALENTMSGYYKAKMNTGIVTAELPGQGSTGKLNPGYLEMANVDLAQEFTDMITTQRGFQANGRIITVTDSMLEELVNLKR